MKSGAASSGEDRIMTALRGLRSRAWTAIAVLVLIASAAVVVELRAGLRVWHETIAGPSPRAAVDPSPGLSGSLSDRPSGVVTLPTRPRPAAPPTRPGPA